MKQTITNFLLLETGKRIKNKSGFSLLEVLIAVAIIGIISAIAIPQFADQRKNAAQVASDTSASNIVKAFQNCVALNPFGSCNSFGALKISCPAGSNCESGGSAPNFCAHLKRGVAGQDDFNVCVSANSNTGSVSRTYGGALLLDEDICHVTYTHAGSCATGTNGVESAISPKKNCTQTNITTDCGTNQTADASTNKCGRTYACKKPTTTGTCTPGTGTCS